MKVFIGSILFSYTQHQSPVVGEGSTVFEVLEDLNRKYPGIKFRIVDEQEELRPHIKIYVTDRWTKNLKEGVTENDELHILGALSGG